MTEPATETRALRRGLPRVAGGEPWPPHHEVVVPARVVDPTPGAVAAAVAPDVPPTVAAPAAAVADPSSAAATEGATAGAVVALRRGLPRLAGGEPWPPAGEAVDRWARLEPAVVEPAAEPAAVEPAAATAADVVAAGSAASAPSAPATGTGRAASTAAPTEAPAPRTLFGIRVRTLVLGAIGLVVLAAVAVLAARWFRDQPVGQEFIAAFPGETHLPEWAPVGIPAWLGWQHFFNVFLMVLIIRSGLQVRTEKRPTAFWTPRWNAKRKMSLALWFHQSLDILWLLNGVVFVVLLAATGQWVRVVPTSWEVIPNAASAALQYLSLDWPTENGWVNYNSLQVLAYFVTIFIAAPLAAITGVRMSGLWPKDAARLNRAYPVEWARAVHFPVMLYFVLFIAVHVVLVLSTGALRNLNHMYGGQDAVNWWGFGIFVVSLLAIAGGWIAARPIVLAPIASLFGTVKGR